MLVKIVGIQSQDYKLDSGYAFTGNKIHVIDMDSAPNGLDGNLVTNFKIPASSPLAAIPLKVGGEYTVYFNQKGVLDFIMEYNPSK